MLENKKIKNATITEYKGIKFRSKLELMIYKVLEENNLNPQYEPVTHTLIEGWKPRVPFYRKNPKTRILSLEDKKIISVKYTPDIVFNWGKYTVYIEAKGMENDVYYLKKKLFRWYLEDKNNSIFAEIKTKRELMNFLEILKTDYNEKS